MTTIIETSDERNASNRRDDAYEDDDSDVIASTTTRQAPQLSREKQVTLDTQPVIQSNVNQTAGNQIVDQNIQENSDVNNYSANDENDGQAEMKHKNENNFSNPDVCTKIIEQTIQTMLQKGLID